MIQRGPTRRHKTGGRTAGPGGSSLLTQKGAAHLIERHTLVGALSRRLGDWLSILCDDNLQDLADLAHVRNMRAGEVVFAQEDCGEVTQSLWVLLDGFVQGSSKPGLQDLLQVPCIDDFRGDPSVPSLEFKQSSARRSRNSVVTGDAEEDSAREAEAKALSARIQQIVDQNKTIKAQNDAIIPVPLFSTRAFGATFGEDQLMSGKQRSYTLTAATQCKLCEIKFCDYLSLFSADLAKSRLREHRKTIIAQTFDAATSSLILSANPQLLPADLRQRLQNEAVLRRYHTGQRIIDPPRDEDVPSNKVAVREGGSFHASHPEAAVRPQQAAERSPGLGSLQQPCVFFLISGKVDRLVFDPCFPSGPKSYGSCEFQGATFGERAVLKEVSPSVISQVAVVAASECQICALPRETLEQILADMRKDSGFTQQLAKHLADEDYIDQLFEPTANFSVLEKENNNALLGTSTITSDEVCVGTNSEIEEALLDEEEAQVECTAEAAEKAGAANPMELAAAAIDQAEAAMLQAERRLQQSHLVEDDADFSYQDIIDCIEQAASEFSLILVKHVTMLPVHGFDVASLEEKMARLDLMLLLAAEMMPPGSKREEKRALCKAVTQIVASQNDFGQALQSRHNNIDFKSDISVCEFLAACQERVKALQAHTPRFRVALADQYGAAMGHRLFDEYHLWMERKSVVWTQCHALDTQYTLLDQQFAELKEKKCTLNEYETYQLIKMRSQRLETLRAAKNLRLDLLLLNRAVVRSCLASMPQTLNTGEQNQGGLLSYVLHLQSIIEAREDLRLSKGILTMQANRIVQESLDEASVGMDARESQETHDPYEPIPIEPDGQRGVAPILQSFLSNNLGSWLFNTDPSRWAKQARMASKQGERPDQ